MPKICHHCGGIVPAPDPCPICFPGLGRNAPELIGAVLEREAERLRREKAEGDRKGTDNRRRTEREGG